MRWKFRFTFSTRNAAPMERQARHLPPMICKAPMALSWSS